MNKIEKVLLAVSLLLLAGCKPDDMSQEMYDYGCDALEIMEDFQNGKYESTDEPYDQLETIYSEVTENKEDDLLNAVDIGQEISEFETRMLNKEMCVSYYAIYGHCDSETDTQEVIDELKETLGK